MNNNPNINLIGNLYQLKNKYCYNWDLVYYKQESKHIMYPYDYYGSKFDNQDIVMFLKQDYAGLFFFSLKHKVLLCLSKNFLRNFNDDWSVL